MSGKDSIAAVSPGAGRPLSAQCSCLRAGERRRASCLGRSTSTAAGRWISTRCLLAGGIGAQPGRQFTLLMPKYTQTEIPQSNISSIFEVGRADCRAEREPVQMWGGAGCTTLDAAGFEGCGRPAGLADVGAGGYR